MVYGPDQSNELSMFDSDSRSIPPQVILKGVYTETLTIFIILHNYPV